MVVLIRAWLLTVSTSVTSLCMRTTCTLFYTILHNVIIVSGEHLVFAFVSR